MQRQIFPTVIRASGDEPSITITTDAEDRDADVIEPSGIVLTNYTSNPVVLFGHAYDELPVGSSTSIDVGPHGIRASWKWLEHDERAARVRNAFEQGVLRSASVGFRPLESEPLGIGRGRRYTRWELLEWSLVPVPANPEAIRTLKHLGLMQSSDTDIVVDLVDPGGCDTLDEVTLSAADDALIDVDEEAAWTGSVRKSTDDDELIDIEDIARAFASEWPRMFRAKLSEVVRRETVKVLARRRGRVDVDDPLADGAAHRHSSCPVGVDEQFVRDVMRQTIVSAIDRRELNELVAIETKRALDRARGRVD